MRVVSENSPEDLARRAAADRYQRALVVLTANLIRVTRGAGQGYEVPRQSAELVRALAGYWDAYGHYPPNHAYNTALQWEKPWNPDLPAGSSLRESGMEATARGALQLVASRLLGQHLQIRAGEDQMYAGMKFVEEGREISRKAWAKQRTAPAPPPHQSSFTIMMAKKAAKKAAKEAKAPKKPE